MLAALLFSLVAIATPAHFAPGGSGRMSHAAQAALVADLDAALVAAWACGPQPFPADATY